MFNNKISLLLLAIVTGCTCASNDNSSRVSAHDVNEEQVRTVASTTPVNSTWTEGTAIGFRNSLTAGPVGVPGQLNVLFSNTATPAGLVWDQWHVIDVANFDIPADAKSVFFSGILIITHAGSSPVCNMYVYFRGYGDTNNPGTAQGQAMSAQPGGGVRSGIAVWVPVVDGKLEFKYTRSTYGTYPYDCSYGFTLSPMAYVR